MIALYLLAYIGLTLVLAVLGITFVIVVAELAYDLSRPRRRETRRRIAEDDVRHMPLRRD